MTTTGNSVVVIKVLIIERITERLKAATQNSGYYPLIGMFSLSASGAMSL